MLRWEVVITFLSASFSPYRFLLFPESKKAGIAADLLLTNPLNSATKLQIGGTLQNYFWLSEASTRGFSGHFHVLLTASKYL